MSHEAVNNVFSFKHLGATLMDQFLNLDYVKSVETIFITSGRDDVLAAKTISDQVFKLIQRHQQNGGGTVSFDCDTCDYNDVCGDVAELRSMRKKLLKKEKKISA
ncbi:MAG: hypothetical protein R2874_02380 [Desulfobacterales bacterium]